MSTTIITIAAIYRKDKWSMNKSVSSDVSIYKPAQQWVEKIGESCTDVVGGILVSGVIYRSITVSVPAKDQSIFHFFSLVWAVTNHLTEVA